MEFQDSSEDVKKGFFDYVFNFDNTNSAQLGNMYQYTFIAIPLVLLSLKSLNYFSPEIDDTKGTLEILFEIFVSINWIILSIWFINKIIRYIPTKSKMSYPIFNEVNFLIPLLIVLFTMNTKLGNKINILIERMVDVYDGKTNLRDNKNNSKDIKTTQPISNNSQQNIRVPLPPPTITNLPNPQVNIQQEMPANQPVNQQQNFNNDFAGPNINNLLATTEPLAANDALGGSFGSVF